MKVGAACMTAFGTGEAQMIAQRAPSIFAAEQAAFL
jgi:hypothetical protein